MSGKITIDTERCKGCGLCVTACPKNCIVISNRPNTIGYFPAEATNTDCTGCAMCAIICPDAAIEVFGESDIVAKPSKKKKPTLIKEKAWDDEEAHSREDNLYYSLLYEIAKGRIKNPQDFSLKATLWH